MSFAADFLLGSSLPILRSSEALEWLDRTGKSLVRWGDGETLSLLGRDIYFQKSSPELSHALRRVLEDDRTDIAIGIPAGPLLSPLASHLRRRGWLRSRLLWAYHGRGDRQYVDAFVFRDEPRPALAFLRRVAARHAFVIVVSSKAEDLEFFLDIGCPAAWIGIAASDCFSELRSILEQVRRTVAELSAKAGRRDGIAFVSAGPTAKALVLELSPGLKSYDVGHLFYFQRHEAKRNVWAG